MDNVNTENLENNGFQRKEGISIIIPAYNEEKRIRKTVVEVRNYLRAKKYSYEIIVVDDGSRDHTVQILKDISIPELRIISITRSGKGRAVKEGIMSAENEFVFFMDADLSADCKEIGKFMGIFKKEPETGVIIGSRYLPQDTVIIQPPLRKLIGKTFSFVKSTLLGINYYDSQCGFKGFRKDAARKIFSRSVIKGFSFDVEILYIANLNKISVKEVAIEWCHKPGGHVNIIADSIPMLTELFVIFLNKNNYLIR